MKNILSKLNKKIFNKCWYKDGFQDISEIIYFYNSFDKKTQEKYQIDGKNIKINSTFFVKVGNLDLNNFNKLNDKEKKDKINKASKIFKEKIKEKQEILKTEVKNIENIIKSKTLNKKEKQAYKIVLGSLKENIYAFKYAINGLPYELEKAGINKNLTAKKITKIDEKQEKLDKILFGGEIIKNIEEIKIAYSLIKNDFETHKDKFSQEDKQFFEQILQKASIYLPKDFEYKQKQKLQNKTLNGEISRKNYTQIFQKILNIYEINQKVIITNVGNVVSSPKELRIPEKDDYETITMTNFLTLIAHEIETHGITLQNNINKNLENIRGAKYIEREEGLAILMEQLVKFGTQIQKIDETSGKIILDIEKIGQNLSSNFGKIMIGEILNPAEFKKFLEIYKKYEISKEDPESRFLKLKRGNLNRINHKNTVYSRGAIQLTQEINKYILSDGKNGINFLDLFLGKVGIDSIKKLKKLDKKESKKPKFFADYIIYLNTFEKTTKEGFINYLKEKYPFLKQYFSKMEIDNLSFDKKRKIGNLFFG